MSNIKIFLDSSALIAGIVSDQGGARALLMLGEAEILTLIVSEQVLAEVERNIARKAPKALPLVRKLILLANIQIMRDPPPDEVQRCLSWIAHHADAPILAAAVAAHVDYLVTLNTRHFTADPGVAEQSGLRIGTPGDSLVWIRQQLAYHAGEKGIGDNG
jgi:predicted nucleic acid-binding protein